MNKQLLLITASLASALLWVGCSKSGKLDKPSTFTPPAGPMELKVKWPLGERVVQEMEMKQTAEITVPNQPNPVIQDLTMGQEYGLTVLKSDAGGAEVEMEFLNLRMMMSMGGKSMMNYDSSKKSAADSANPMAAMFQKIIGAKLNCSWTPATRWTGSKVWRPW